MAPGIRMTTNVAAFAIGDFGAAVASQFASLGPKVTLFDIEDLPMVMEDAAAVVVAAWRATPDVFELADVMSFDLGVPWMPIVNEFPRVRVGPLVAPGDSACHACFVRRHVQHDPQWKLEAALQEAYVADPRLGPRGFSPHDALFAAGLAVDVIARYLEREPFVAGRLRYFNVVNHDTRTTQVVGVHGCRRCGPPPDPHRTTRRLDEWFASETAPRG